MKLMSSRCFVVLLLSTHRVQCSPIARQSNLSTPAQNQLFDIVENSTGSNSDQTLRYSDGIYSEETATSSNPFQGLENSISPLPDEKDQFSQRVTDFGIVDLTTQPVGASDVGENISSLSSANQTSTSCKGTVVNIAMTDIAPTTGVSEIIRDPTTTVKDSEMAFEQTDEMTRVQDDSSNVSTVSTANFDSITMSTTTNGNFTKDSTAIPDLTANYESMTIGSATNDTNIVENTNATKSGDENRANQKSWVPTLLLMTVGTVNLVLNILNVIIYSERKTPSAAYIIMLGGVDIVDCLMFLSFGLLDLTANISSTVNINSSSWILMVVNNVVWYLKQLSRTLNTLISADRFFVIHKIWKSKNRFQKYPKTIAGIVALVLLVCTALQASTGNSSLDESPPLSSSLCQDAQKSSNITTMNSANRNISFTQNTGKGESALEMTTAGVTSAPEGINIFFVIVTFFNVIYTFIMYPTIAVFNIAALVSLRKHARECKRLNLYTTTRDSKTQDNKQSALLLTMTTVYILLSLPEVIVLSVKVLEFSQEKEVCSSTLFLRIATVAGFFTSSSDFVVFFVMSKSFREKLIALFVGSARLNSHT